MIGVHRTGREPPAAVGARDIPMSIKDRCLLAPVPSLPIEIARRPPACPSTRSMPVPRPYAMTVRAHDIAFPDLLEDRCRRTKHRAAGSEPEPLGRGVPMVEVHLWCGSKMPPQSKHGRSRSSRRSSTIPRWHAHARDLEVAVAPVIRDIGLPLTSPSHAKTFWNIWTRSRQPFDDPPTSAGIDIDECRSPRDHRRRSSCACQGGSMEPFPEPKPGQMRSIRNR